jgi:hypothetical protein
MWLRFKKQKLASMKSKASVPNMLKRFTFSDHGWNLEQVGTVPPGGDHRVDQKESLWYEIAAAKSVHSLYHLAILNTRLPEATFFQYDTRLSRGISCSTYEASELRF